MPKVLIDTDPGIDDAMAIFYAGLHPDIDLIGMTGVFGNVTVDTAARNAIVLSDMLGQDIPVAKGAAEPLVQVPNPVSDYVHGDEGFGDLPAQTPSRPPLDIDAADFIIETVNAHPGEVILAPIGPLTNIAEALRRDPGIAGKVRRLVIMGGGMSRGNVTEFAEANIWNDPHAADAVFAANWPMTMIGLDVTMQVLAYPADFEKCATAAPQLGGFLHRITQFYMRFYRAHYDLDGAQMHDPTALIAITNPEYFELEPLRLEVILSGDRAGQTQRSDDPNRSAVDVALGVDAEAVKARFLSVIGTGH